MGAAENITRCREALAAWATGDIPTVRDVMAEDIVWHWAGQNQISGDSHGPDGVLAAMGKGFMLTGGTLRIEEEDILASDNHLGVFLRVSGDRESRSFVFSIAQAIKVDEDGKWSESWFVPNDRAAFDALMA
jgi:hypothetical protein